jgi:NADPH:quinone reductase-like Zn-dependent oxidoreductase
MKAIAQKAYGPIDDLRLVDRDAPKPAKTDVLIRVRAAGVDPGIWHTMTGRPFMVRTMGLGFSAPKVPVAGWDAAGIVEATGPGVTRFKPGDEVFGNSDVGGTGTFAEYACLPESHCAAKPTNLTFEESAALPVSGCTALQAVRKAGNVRAGTQVLILGAAGGVGHLALQVAKADGAIVTAVCSTSKLDFVRTLGADGVIDYTKESLAAAGRTWDVIIDTAGRRPIAQLRGVLAKTGVLVIVGGEGGNRWTGGFLERMFSAKVRSLFSTQKLMMLTAAVNSADLLELKKLAEAGALRPVISRTYSLDQAVEALKELERGHARGKTAVIVAQ